MTFALPDRASLQRLLADLRAQPRTAVTAKAIDKVTAQLAALPHTEPVTLAGGTSMAAPTDPLQKAIYDKLCAKGVKAPIAAKMAQRGASMARRKRKPAVKGMSRSGAAVEMAAVPVNLRAKARQTAAGDGAALPDGSWPVRNRGELGKALQSWGHAVKAGNTSEVRNHLLKRAKVLGCGPAVVGRIRQLAAGGGKAMSSPKGSASLELASWSEVLHPRWPKGHGGGEFRGIETGAFRTAQIGKARKRASVLAPKRHMLSTTKLADGFVTHEQIKKDLASYLDAHPDQFRAGTHVAVADHKGEKRLVRAGTALALAATLSGWFGANSGSEDFAEVPDSGPSASEMYTHFHDIEPGDVMQLQQAQLGSSTHLSNEEAGMAAHTVVARVKGTPIVRLNKDWTDMTAAERDAFLTAVTAQGKKGGKK